MSAISIIKYIYNLLATDEELAQYVGENIYPLFADDAATFPFVVLHRNTVNPVYHKMGTSQDISTVAVAIVATTYSQSVDIAERVRTILENHKDDVFSIIRLQDVSEDFIDDAYVQELNFECTVNTHNTKK